LKPENLVLDSHGYIRITDFGIACIADQQGQKDTSGTPGYMGIFMFI
jgi:serine/threonine protein kinase